MTRAASLLAVRHCESTGPEPDAPLTARGLAQAERLADALGGRRIERIVSSPYRRARETIAPLAARLGVALELDERLAEHRLSAERTRDWRSHVARAFVDLDARAPGGDPPRETQARGWAALEDALAAEGALIVTHGQLLSLVLQRVDARFGFAEWEAMTNPDVFQIERAADGALRFARVRLSALC